MNGLMTKHGGWYVRDERRNTLGTPDPSFWGFSNQTARRLCNLERAFSHRFRQVVRTDRNKASVIHSSFDETWGRFIDSNVRAPLPSICGSTSSL